MKGSEDGSKLLELGPDGTWRGGVVCREAEEEEEENEEGKVGSGRWGGKRLEGAGAAARGAPSEAARARCSGGGRVPSRGGVVVTLGEGVSSEFWEERLLLRRSFLQSPEGRGCASPVLPTGFSTTRGAKFV